MWNVVDHLMKIHCYMLYGAHISNFDSIHTTSQNENAPQNRIV